VKIIAVVMVLLTMHTCNTSNTLPPERAAYDTIVAAKGFLDSEYRGHPECKTNTTAATSSTVCLNLSRAVGAKDALIDATEVYCGGNEFEGGGPCVPPTSDTPAAAQAIARLNAAIANYQQTEADVRKVVQ
jgi:hypothetical protein